jgi:hypothetical protein
MKRDRDLTDGFYRATLLEWLYESKYKDNKKLKHFIVHEASYEDVILAVIDKKPFFEQTNETKNSRALRIQKVEEKSSIFMDILGFLFGGFVTEQVAAKHGVNHAALKAQGIAKAATAKAAGKSAFKQGAKTFGRKAAWGATRIGVGWFIIPGILVWIAKKAIFGTLRKVNKQCVQNCTMRMKSAPQRKISTNICISRCKITDYQRGMSKLNGQMTQCNSPDVKNPEKCKQGLMKTMGQFRDMINKEKEKLQKLNLKLRGAKTPTPTPSNTASASGTSSTSTSSTSYNKGNVL